MTTYRLLVAIAFSFLATMAFCMGLSADEPREADAAGDVRAPQQGDATSANEEKTDSQDIAGAVSADPTEADNGDSREVIQAIQAGPRALSLAFRMAAKRATPSVVTLLTYGQAADESSDGSSSEDDLPFLEKVEPRPETRLDRPTGVGSGVILSADGLIITNNHVVARATRVVVQLHDETKLEAELFRGDPDSDVAMVRVKSDEPLQAISVGDSDELEIGDWVLAIGSPFKLEATVSAGIISAKNREIDSVRRSNMLQTDAAINPGNSGGALIDLSGNVIGISTAIATRTGFYQGVGFAIPINQARWIADELDQHGKVRRAAIGTTLADLKPRIAKQFGEAPYSGVLVYQVIKDSVADKAGLLPYDVIIEFDGRPVCDSVAFQQAIERKPIGSRQPIVVRREGDRVELEVELATVDNPTGDSKPDE
ncbi:MAG: trypsin-like peptidase domain-containing protein [Planctomycetota bacterium]